MRSPARARFFFALALSSVGAACTYDPHPKDGQEQCSSKDRLCPWGYDCADNNLCYSWGHLPANPGAGGTISSTGGRSAAGGNSGAGGTHSATVIGAAGVITAGGVTHAGGVISVGGLIVSGGGAGIPDSGGGLSTGGTVGTGGATDCTPSKASGLTPLIDNMADGDTGIIAQDGRMGGWYTYGDGTGTSSLDSSKARDDVRFGIWFFDLGRRARRKFRRRSDQDLYLRRLDLLRHPFHHSRGHYQRHAALLGSDSGYCVGDVGRRNLRFDQRFPRRLQRHLRGRPVPGNDGRNVLPKHGLVLDLWPGHRRGWCCHGDRSLLLHVPAGVGPSVPDVQSQGHAGASVAVQDLR